MSKRKEGKHQEERKKLGGQKKEEKEPKAETEKERIK